MPVHGPSRAQVHVLDLGSLDCKHALKVRGKVACLLEAEAVGVWAGLERGDMVLWGPGSGGSGIGAVSRAGSPA